MSTTYHLACKQCLQELWVGQRGSANCYPSLYSPDTHQAALLLFLVTHQRHDLVFGTDDEIEGACRDGKPVEFQTAYTDPDLLADVLARFSLTAHQIDDEIAP